MLTYFTSILPSLFSIRTSCAGLIANDAIADTEATEPMSQSCNRARAVSYPRSLWRQLPSYGAKCHD